MHSDQVLLKPADCQMGGMKGPKQRLNGIAARHICGVQDVDRVKGRSRTRELEKKLAGLVDEGSWYKG